MPGSILIVAGETSGDILGAAIIDQWKKTGVRPKKFWGFGGSRMEQAGVEILRDIHELSVIGFWEAIVNYRRLNNYLNSLVLEAKKRKISGVILIDYPGFNLKLARKMAKFQVPVCLVVSPQIWAWHYSRIFSIKRYVHYVFCLYKFELDIYKKENIPAIFIGHPVFKKIKNFMNSHAIDISRLIKQKKRNRKIALLPGSRKSEIKRHLPFLISLAQHFYDLHPDSFFEIPCASDQIAGLIREYNLPHYIFLREADTYLTLATSDSGVVCSGTATLECALFNLPFLLIYKTSPASYFIGKKLIQIPYIGLVNVLRNSFVTKEFIQSDMDEKLVLKELENINFNKKYIKSMQNEFLKVKREVYSLDPAKKAARYLSGIFK